MAIDVSTLYIVNYPAPVLRKKATPVPEVTDEVRAVAKRMIELMREAEGVGLAAPQVGLSWRMFVAHVPADEGRSVEDVPPTATREPRVYINPVISDPQGPPVASSEGCLSLPDIRGDVLRPPMVTITATGLDGRIFSERGAGLLARCWQHELDHLDGVLIIDRMTQMSRLKNKAALRDLERSEVKR
jgi:peptide deformylase